MTPRELEQAIERAVERATAPLIRRQDDLLRQMEDLRFEILALSENVGERSLSLSKVAEMSGHSKRTVQRRVAEGRLATIPGTSPHRVLYSEFLRATREGDL